MQRYFTEIKENDLFIINKEDTYHIKKVMRMNVGDKVEIVYKNKLYITEIVDISEPIKTKIISMNEENNELDNNIILVQSLVKEQKMDLVLQKSTELGVNKIIPYRASRSIIKENDRQDKKIERWNKITKEASEQSKRTFVPVVTECINLEKLIDVSENIDVKILCTVNEKSINLSNIISNINSRDTIMIVVGPEGGFTAEEEKKMVDNGFISTSLGKSILRTETASMFVLSCIRYQNMR